ncbi:MAG: stage V sporulation protein E [Coriobacteriia bacterium]
MAARRFSGAAYLMIGVTVFLVLGGLMMIYSASSVAAYVQEGDSAHYLLRQARWAVAGALALWLLSRWDLRGRVGVLAPRLVAWAVWGASVAGLIAVKFVGVGKWGATRWLSLGPIAIQPSEYAKLGCILVTAVLLAAWRRHEIEDKQLLLYLTGAVGLVGALVMLQPDMGTTVSIVISVFVLLWLGGVRASIVGGIGLFGVSLAALMVAVEGYRMERITAFLDPWADPLGSGYQIIQSTYAFGSGGLSGVGLGLSRQKFFYLPAAHTDFIFAIIGEELGLIGTLAVVVAFALFAYAGFRIALDCKEPFGRMLAGGLTAMVVVQALLNMAAVTGLMPITGIPLPLVSYGGSSLTFTLGCIGLILAVARFPGTAARAGGTGRGSGRAGSHERRRNRRSHLSSIDGGRGDQRRRA